jgi:hypothetical protein
MQLEGHITRNLTHALWVSLDALFMDGGETTTDGVSDHNRQRSAGVGASLSVALGERTALLFSYTEVVSHDPSGVSGHVIRVVAEFSL